MPTVEQYIVDATLEVFATLVFADITALPPLTGGEDTIDANLTSMIGLAGDLKGVLAIHCPASAACGIAGAMLGTECAEIDDDVKDAIGEIANMVAGGLKTALAADGVNTELAIPTTVQGKNVRTSGQPGVQRFVLPFDTPVGRFGVELKYVLGGTAG